MRVAIALILTAAVSVQGFTSPFMPRTSSSTTTSLGVQSRKEFVQSLVVGTGGAVASQAALPFMVPAAMADGDTVALPSGVVYKVNKSGNGPKPEVGELAAIRFRAFYGQLKIDDITETPEPYYTRVGSGGLLKGVEEVLPMMRTGDKWTISIPPNLAFGPKGRPASAGKPRIPGDATIVFEVEMVGVPGREPELIELIGDV